MLRMSSSDELREWVKSREREWDVDVKSGVVRLREEHKTDIEVCEFPTHSNTLNSLQKKNTIFLWSVLTLAVEFIRLIIVTAGEQSILSLS
jgi:hypothetical protein